MVVRNIQLGVPALVFGLLGASSSSLLLSFENNFENNYFTEMCSGSEAGSYLRLIDFVYHSTLGLRVITRERESLLGAPRQHFSNLKTAGKVTRFWCKV